MTTTRITIYQEDAQAIRGARRILNRLIEAGLASAAHGESLAALQDDLEAIESRITASLTDTFSRNVSGRHLEPVA